MTVIAIRDGVIATDTAVWQGAIISGHTQKIITLNDGRLFAGSGQRASVQACRAWLDGEGNIPEGEEEGRFVALILARDGVTRIDHRFRRSPAPEATFHVAGGHDEFMIGAMMAGASAEEAVRLAIKLGDCAGGEVLTARLGRQPRVAPPPMIASRTPCADDCSHPDHAQPNQDWVVPRGTERF